MNLRTAGIAAETLMASNAVFAQSAMPREKVITFVQKAPAPKKRVVIKEKIVVGQPLRTP